MTELVKFWSAINQTDQLMTELVRFGSAVDQADQLMTRIGPFWSDIDQTNQLLKVGTNENGSACGRWLLIGI